mmetsp:Transcript_12039/g.18204  ORF Transcript_12039/g.18204 Transcript_12039/m.18204 type:complete len:85 (+) Transcript_12039:140-394(+)
MPTKIAAVTAEETAAERDPFPRTRKAHQEVPPLEQPEASEGECQAVWASVVSAAYSFETEEPREDCREDTTDIPKLLANASQQN